MEAVVGGVISRPVPCFSSAAGIDAQSQYSHDSSSLCLGLRRMCYRKTRKVAGLSGLCFRDNHHLEYYSSSVGGKIKCKKLDKAMKKEKIKDEHKATQEMMKKMMKVMLEEGLSRRDLSMFFSSRHDPDNLLFDQLKAKTISEATEVLQGQLQRLMREDMESKKMTRKKNEEIRLKLPYTSKCEISSSSSSESSDSDSGEVVGVSKNCLNLAQTVLKPVIEHESLVLPGILEEERVVSTATEGGNLPVRDCVGTSTGRLQQGCCFGTGGFCSGHVDNLRSTNNNGIVVGASTKKIEVCMGSKCKKSGAAVLLGEFQRLVGVEGAVSGCKCMGKCRDGPNVRILNDPVKPAANPLCAGVRLEDVDLIVANFIGESSELGLAAAS